MTSTRLFAEREAVVALRAALDRHGFDLAHETVRADYLTSPFPHPDALRARLGHLDPGLRMMLRLYTLGDLIEPDEIVAALGNDWVEANLLTGMLAFDAAGERLSTAGLQLVSRLGQYFVVSTSRAYPGFDPELADVYLGPESYTLANHLQRAAFALASTGNALDFCTGSGIAAQSLAAIRRGLVWTGVDLSPQAVEAATFNAMLNDLHERYRALEGDLYEPVDGQHFQVIVANPPFIPVPDGTDFPVYGAGGDDGQSVLRPLLAGLPGHLAPSGRAIIYAEGLAIDGLPVVLELLEPLARAGYSIGLTTTSMIPADQALFTLGRMLAVQQPSRLEELSAWTDLFARRGATHYVKFLIDVRAGAAAVTVRSIESR
jgi:hypothetical protein